MSGKPIPEAVAWPFSILEAGNWREVYIGTKHMRLEVSYPYEAWERLMAALTAAQQQGQAKDCHCATCTYHPGMTPTVRFDTTPADKEGAVRDHLIALGWTPPNTAPPPSTPVGVEASYHPCTSVLIEGLKRLEGGSDVLAEWDRARAKADTALAQQPAVVDEAMVKRAAAAVMSAPPGISVEAYVRIVLEAALTEARNG